MVRIETKEQKDHTGKTHRPEEKGGCIKIKQLPDMTQCPEPGEKSAHQGDRRRREWACLTLSWAESVGTVPVAGDKQYHSRDTRHVAMSRGWKPLAGNLPLRTGLSGKEGRIGFALMALNYY